MIVALGKAAFDSSAFAQECNKHARKMYASNGCCGSAVYTRSQPLTGLCVVWKPLVHTKAWFCLKPQTLNGLKSMLKQVQLQKWRLQTVLCESPDRKHCVVMLVSCVQVPCWATSACSLHTLPSTHTCPGSDVELHLM